MKRQNSECPTIDKQCRRLPEGWKPDTPLKKILLVSYYYPPCIYGYAVRVYNFMRSLGRFGWKPYVLTVDPAYYKGRSVKSRHVTPDSSIKVLRTGSLEPKRSLLEMFCSNKKKSHKNSKAVNINDGSSSGIINTKNYYLIPDNQVLWLFHAVLGGQRLILKEGIDLIYVTSPPFSPLLVGYLLKKATGKPFLFEYRDAWQDDLDHRQYLSPARRKIEEFLERIVVKNADRIIPVTEGMKKNLLKKFPDIPQEKFQVVPNGFDPTLCGYLNRHGQSSENVFTITYSGSLEYDRDPREFLWAMKELFRDHPEAAREIRIDLIGSTEQVFIDFVREQELSSKVRFLGYLDYEENIKHLAASDLLFLIANDSRPDSIPGKLYEYLLVNKPILALVGDNVSGNFLADFPRAQVLKPLDRQGMKDFVWKSFQNYLETGHRSWELDKSTLKYCRKNQTRRLAEIFNSHIPPHVENA